MSRGKIWKSTVFTLAFKKALEFYDLKQKDIAEKIEMPTGRVSEYATGKTDPTIENVNKIAAAFNLSISEFFALGLEGAERPPAAPPAVVQPPAPATISPERELELLRRIEAMTVKWEGLSDEMLIKDARIKEKDKIIDGKNEIIKQLSAANGKLIDILKEAGEEDRLPPELIFSALMSLAEVRNPEK